MSGVASVYDTPGTFRPALVALVRSQSCLRLEGRARTLSGPSRIRGPPGPLYLPSVVTLPLPNLIELHYQLGNLRRPGFQRAGRTCPMLTPEDSTL